MFVGAGEVREEALQPGALAVNHQPRQCKGILGPRTQPAHSGVHFEVQPGLLIQLPAGRG